MATSNAHDATLLLDFNPWFFNTFISQFKQIVGAPGLDSTHMILDQYSSISRTPFGSNPDVQNEYHGKDAIEAGYPSIQVEAYCSKVGGTPGLESTHMILDQYSSISRTPSGLYRDTPNEYHGNDAIKTGYPSLQVETFCSTVGGTREGPFDLRKVEPAEEGVVTVDCIRKLGGEETVVATWKFVKKMG
ncbi:MAG: hypothetical protein Q9161_001127 [Pseudevernia consocians]